MYCFRMSVKLVLLVFVVIPLVLPVEICKPGKWYKMSKLTCAHFNFTQGWQNRIPLKLDRLVFKDVTGSFDLSNLTHHNLKYLVETHSQVDNFTLGDFPNLISLTLSKNQQFPNLVQTLFLKASHINWLSLISNNHTISPNAFHFLKNLTWLHVQNQKLVSLNGDFFKENTKLHELSIRNCGLQEVEFNAFEKTTQLEILGLNFNKLTHFEDGTFAKLKKLKILELHHNHFVQFSLKQFSGLVSVEILGFPSIFWRHVNITDLRDTFPNLKKVEVKRNSRREHLIKELRVAGIDVIGTPYDFAIHNVT